MTNKQNTVGWFEIPVRDMDRAKKFYSAVLGQELTEPEIPGLRMALFPHTGDAPGAGGGLVYMPDYYAPSDSAGVLVYISAPSGDLANELQRIPAAGGKILSPKKQISPEHGYMALFLDTEGNRLALHSNSA